MTPIQNHRRNELERDPDSSHPMLSGIRDRRGMIVVVTATALLYGVVILGRLAYHQWDASFFVAAGQAFCEQSRMPLQLKTTTRYGYDGQFYYRLALNPFTHRRVEYGITIDNLPYRQQRILYPVLVHVLALGVIGWVPWSMIVVNYLAVCWLAFHAAGFAQRFAVPAIYGLAIPLYPGILLGMVRDLPDPLAISLMVSSLYLLHSHRIALGGCLLGLAVLTRETIVLVAAALLVHSIWRGLRRQSEWTETLWLMIPLLTYAAWQLWIFARWGTLGVAAGSANLNAFPLKSFALLFIHGAQSALTLDSFGRTAEGLMVCAELVFLGAMVGLAAITSARSEVGPGVKLAWLLYLLLAAFLSRSVWSDDWAFTRGCAELIILGFAIVLGSGERRRLPTMLAPTFVLWLALAVRSVVAQ
jgi:hypothetical protein